MKGEGEDTYMDQPLYHSAVGSLLCLSTVTRPDITYAVSNVAKFGAKPTKQHWVAVKHIFRYLKGTQKNGILYRKSDSNCVGFSDADWEVTWMIANLLLGNCFKLVEQLLIGGARSRYV